MSVLIELQNVGKSYPGVRALEEVSLEIRAGECHALVGENGAGKSTLLRILGGVIAWPDYEGRMLVDGTERRFTGVRDAEAAGIAVVHQELALVGPLDVADNISLGHQPHRLGVVDRAAVLADARRALSSIGAVVDPEALVERLGVGQQQLVEIARALSRNARVLVLDEPTAALAEADADHLLERVAYLRAQGLAIVYVSHRLAEVRRIADRVTVLRDGRTVWSGLAGDYTEHQLVAAMVGRSVETLYPPAGRRAGANVLSVRGLSVEDPSAPGRRLLEDASFDVRAGEVLGVAGLMGAGRTTLLSALFGNAPGRVGGRMELEGRPFAPRSPREAIGRGLALLTEDRKRFGLLEDESVAVNVTLASLGRVARRGVFVRGAEHEAGRTAIVGQRIRAASPAAPAHSLSGGNQQKVLVARWLRTAPRVLLLDEPTRGVDVGARQEIYATIDRLARDGLAVVVVSSDLPEVLGLSDRVIVLRQGRVAAEFAHDTATPEAVMAAATGTAPGS